MNWLIRFFGKTGDVRIGTRVRTSLGRGVITNGCVSVKYDEGTKLPSNGRRHANDLTISHNLSAIEIL